MKRMLTIAILAMAMSSLALAQTSDKKAGPSSKAEQEVVKAVDELIEALGRTDIATLDRIYADDYIVTQSFGITSKTQLLDAWKSGSLKYTFASGKDRSVRVYGDAAVITGILTLKGQNPNGDFTIYARTTGVWVKQQGRWRLVASQLSDIPQKQSQ